MLLDWRASGLDLDGLDLAGVDRAPHWAGSDSSVSHSNQSYGYCYCSKWMNFRDDVLN